MAKKVTRIAASGRAFVAVALRGVRSVVSLVRKSGKSKARTPQLRQKNIYCT